MIDIKWPAAQLSELCKKAKDTPQNFMIEFLQELGRQLVIGTPVAKTGFLRGSWKAAINQEPTGAGSADKSGGTSIASIIAAAVKYKLGDIFYMVNTAIYARRVELGFVGRDSLGRMYHQQGRAFVAAVANRAQSIASTVASRMGIRVS